MAFKNKPIVHPNHVLSEQSEHKFTAIFSLLAGFIARKEFPDYGVDYDIELIKDGVASGYRFPVQIKSTQQVRSLDFGGVTFILAKMETSRINYLCARPPIYGIIIVYEGATDSFYFDFVENIITNLNWRNKSKKWKENKHVTIYLPKEKILNDASLKTIHKIISNRFADHATLLNVNGSNFGIPAFDSDFSEQTPPITDNTIQFLIDHGFSLYYNKNYVILLNLIKGLRVDFSKADPIVIFLSLVTYYETGNYIEADYYLKLSQAIYPKYSKHYREIIEIYSLLIYLHFGRTSHDSFLEALKKLKVSKINYNLRLSLLIAHYRLKFGNLGENFNAEFTNEIITIHQEIEKFSADTYSKQIFNLDICDMFISVMIINYHQAQRLIDAGIDNSNIQNKYKIYRAGIVEGCLLIQNAMIYADEMNNDYLIAESSYKASLCYSILLLLLSEQEIKTLNLLSEQTHATYFNLSLTNLLASAEIFNNNQNSFKELRALSLFRELLILGEGKQINYSKEFKLSDVVDRINELASAPQKS